MIHIMKLQEEYFNYIKNGSKLYEIRLNDEKRRNIKIGDYIEFQKEPELKDKIVLEVNDLLYYDNFNKLLNDINIIELADKSILKEDLLNDLERFYSKDKQNEYGVVAIKLNKDIIINHSNINLINEDIFYNIKDNYNNFDIWLNKMKNNNIDVYYTENSNIINSILILKINEKDSIQFKENGNILKIRTLLVNDSNMGIGTNYLKFVDNVSRDNNINYIYLTVKNNNIDLIKFLEKNNYKKYNEIEDEYVYYKELV